MEFEELYEIIRARFFGERKQAEAPQAEVLEWAVDHEHKRTVSKPWCSFCGKRHLMKDGCK